MADALGGAADTRTEWEKTSEKVEMYQHMVACSEDESADEGARERVLLRLATFLEAEEARGVNTWALQEDCARRMSLLRMARFERTGTTSHYVDPKVEGR